MFCFVYFCFPVQSDVVKPKTEKEKLKELFPALCRPDNPTVRVSGSVLSSERVFLYGTLSPLASVVELRTAFLKWVDFPRSYLCTD